MVQWQAIANSIQIPRSIKVRGLFDQLSYYQLLKTHVVQATHGASPCNTVLLSVLLCSYFNKIRCYGT
jgi:hypothetical protein